MIFYCFLYLLVFENFGSALCGESRIRQRAANTTAASNATALAVSKNNVSAAANATATTAILDIVASPATLTTAEIEAKVEKDVKVESESLKKNISEPKVAKTVNKIATEKKSVAS